jgi:DNA-binding IclR family transcriptional regulator
VLVAWRPEAEIERFIRHGLPALSPRTITDPEEFRDTLAEVRRAGYALNDQERELLIRSVSAPIRDARGAVVAALTVAGPSQRLSKTRLPRVTAQVMEAAADLSSQLGGLPASRARSAALR